MSFEVIRFRVAWLVTATRMASFTSSFLSVNSPTIYAARRTGSAGRCAAAASARVQEPAK